MMRGVGNGVRLRSFWSLAGVALAIAGGATTAGAQAPVAVQGSPSIVAPGAVLQELSGGFSFTEGPACDAHGNVFFTDQPSDRILEWNARTGDITTFLSPCGRSNGLCFDRKGNLWACADGQNQLWRITKKGRTVAVVSGYQGSLLNGPNDVWVRPDGGLYITDPYYMRSYWKRGPKEQTCEGVYYLPSGRTTLTLVAADLEKPNGIIGTPDGKTLYVSDIKAGHTFAYDIEADGTLGNKRPFCDVGSDGMTIDSDGDVYVTGRGVTVFDPAGRQILHIPVDQPWTGNICFGGRDRTTLFITASTGVYTLKMRVHGVGSQ